MQKAINTLVYTLTFIYLFFRNGFKNKTAFFYPRKPGHRTAIYKTLKSLHFNISDNPKCKFNIAINWEDTTFRKPGQLIEALSKTNKILNSNCSDISKQYIGEVFEEVFGYSILINPTTHDGICVKKNNLNARKDGIIIECPIDKVEDDFVYLKLIDNKSGNEHVADIRVPLFGNQIPFVYLKIKNIGERFTNDTTEVRLENTKDHLTIDEIAKTVMFCKKIGLDTGELDLLRNATDGKIYIVDVNNTPWGPPAGLNKTDTKLAIKKMAETFEMEFLN